MSKLDKSEKPLKNGRRTTDRFIYRGLKAILIFIIALHFIAFAGNITGEKLNSVIELIKLLFTAISPNL